MIELKKIENEKLLQELQSRLSENKISEEEIFQTLSAKEAITEYETVDLKKLTKEE
jgi:hypothetical protein